MYKFVEALTGNSRNVKLDVRNFDVENNSTIAIIYI